MNTVFSVSCFSRVSLVPVEQQRDSALFFIHQMKRNEQRVTRRFLQVGTYRGTVGAAMKEAIADTLPTNDRLPAQTISYVPEIKNDIRQTSASSPIGAVVHLMLMVDTTSKTASLNEMSMSDNNGGRIWF